MNSAAPPAAETPPLLERVEAAASQMGRTPRQQNVLHLMLAGVANKDLATALGCNGKTVEAHISALFHKSGKTSRAEVLAHFLAPVTLSG